MHNNLNLIIMEMKALIKDMLSAASWHATTKQCTDTS